MPRQRSRRGCENSQAKGPVSDETPESGRRTEEAIRPGGESFRSDYGGAVFGMGQMRRLCFFIP